MRKTLSRIVDIILGILLVFMAYVHISMLVTQANPNNYGVPSVFGTSFLYVATDSMEGDKADSLNQGTGVIIKKDDPKNVKVGDVITFYYPKLRNPDTHRVVEISTDENGSRTFHTRGDNLNAWSCPKDGCPETAWESIPEKYYIGTVQWHSDSFGQFLTIVSPQAAGAAGKTAWLVPVMIAVPIVGIVTISIVETAVNYRKEKKAYQAELKEAMERAGVDPNNEKEALLFEEKFNYKKEVREEMEKTKAAERKRLQKELDKEAKRKAKEERKGGKNNEQ